MSLLWISFVRSLILHMEGFVLTHSFRRGHMVPTEQNNLESGRNPVEAKEKPAQSTNWHLIDRLLCTTSQAQSLGCSEMSKRHRHYLEAVSQLHYWPSEWDRSQFCGAILYIVGCLAASLTSTHLEAGRSVPRFQCDIQTNLQTLQMFPRGRVALRLKMLRCLQSRKVTKTTTQIFMMKDITGEVV